MVETARLEAMFRMLLDSGDITPMGVRMIRKIIPDDSGPERALLSWIEGACVDEAPHTEIRAAITRYRETQK